MAAPMSKPHHAQQEFCSTRARYREGRELKAVKVYTVNQESRYLLVQGIPAVGAHDDLLKMFALYGAIQEYRILDEYPCDEFTEVMWIKFQKLPSARIAKRKMDNQSFYGGVLHVCYAPEYESVQDTREKLQDRRRTIAAKIRKLEIEEGTQTKQRPPTSTMASAEEWSYRAQKPTTQRPPPTHSPQPGPSAPHTERTHPQNWSHNRTEEPHRHIPNRPPYPPLPPPPRHPPPPHPRREDLSRTDSDGRRSDHHTGNERDGYKGSPLDNERDGYKGSPLNNERDGYKGSPLNNERDGYKGSPLDNERDGYKGSPLDNERDGYKGSPLNNERDGYKGSPLDNERDGYKGSPLDNERDGYKGSPLNNERDGYKGSPLNNERDGYKGSPLDNERDGYKGSPLDNERDGYKGSPLNNERDGYKGSPLNNERDGYKGSPLDNERDGYKGSPLNNERDGYKGSPLDHHTRTSETKRELPDTSKNKTKPGQTVIKEFKSKTVPRFVPRQVRGRSKPLIKKHLLVKPAPAPAASVPALETDSQSEDAGLKAESWVPPRERDSVNAALKAESCVLRDVHGPRLPEPQEAKREAFKSSETGDESVDETVAAIRKRVHEFSTIAPPPQLKKKRKK